MEEIDQMKLNDEKLLDRLGLEKKLVMGYEKLSSKNSAD